MQLGKNDARQNRLDLPMINESPFICVGQPVLCARSTLTGNLLYVFLSFLICAYFLYIVQVQLIKYYVMKTKVANQELNSSSEIGSNMRRQSPPVVSAWHWNRDRSRKSIFNTAFTHHIYMLITGTVALGRSPFSAEGTINGCRPERRIHWNRRNIVMNEEVIAHCLHAYHTRPAT